MHLPAALVIGLTLVAALAAPLTAHADEGAPAGEAPRMEFLPMTGLLTAERVRLPNDEHMGLVGGSLLFDIGAGWSLGPGVYGAVTGQRGGLFVGGIEVQRRWALGFLGDGYSLATGLYAGGGGGAAAPVGSGLMLRPAVTLLKDLGPTWQLGLSWSSVRFPSGEIRSNQLGLVLGWRQEFMHYSGSGIVTDAGGALPVAGLGFDRFAATVSTYRIDDGDQSRRIGLVGARAERRSSARDVTWGLEAAAAAKGNAAGYLEVLGTAAYSVAPFAASLPSWRVGARLGVGAGGGGAVPTGGGLLAKATATTEISPYPGWTLGADYGVAHSRTGGFRAREIQAWLALDLEPALTSALASGGSGASDAARPLHVARTEWVGTIQHHTRIPRTDGSERALDTIGLKLNRYFGEHLYVSGQAHSAFAGGAGAYSVGLVGFGLSASPMESVRIGAEALAGAAGGGGVTTAGGAIVQGLMWGAWQPWRVGELRLGVGATRVRGNSTTGGTGSTKPVAELSWARAFGVVAP